MANDRAILKKDVQRKLVLDIGHMCGQQKQILTRITSNWVPVTSAYSRGSGICSHKDIKVTHIAIVSSNTCFTRFGSYGVHN